MGGSRPAAPAVRRRLQAQLNRRPRLPRAHLRQWGGFREPHFRGRQHPPQEQGYSRPWLRQVFRIGTVPGPAAVHRHPVASRPQGPAEASKIALDWDPPAKQESPPLTTNSPSGAGRISENERTRSSSLGVTLGRSSATPLCTPAGTELALSTMSRAHLGRLDGPSAWPLSGVATGEAPTGPTMRRRREWGGTGGRHLRQLLRQYQGSGVVPCSGGVPCTPAKQSHAAEEC